VQRIAVATPLGPFFVGLEDGRLIQSGFAPLGSAPATPAERAVADALRAYFEAGRPLPALPLDPKGPPFFQRVWRTLAASAPSEVTTYGELAARVGNPRAARAVAAAMAQNPLPLFVPCHRVIRADGRLGGYGPAPWRKAALLLLEAGQLDLEDRLPRLRAHPDLAAVRLDDLLGDREP